MTSRVIREDDGQLKEIVISCDHIDCDVHHNNTYIADNGGLKEMGWTFAPFGEGFELRHYCPKHSRS